MGFECDFSCCFIHAARPDAVHVYQKRVHGSEGCCTCGQGDLGGALRVFGVLETVGTAAVVHLQCGHIAQAQIKRSGENGRVLAVVGTVLGYVSIVSWIVVSILSVFFVALVSEGMTGFQPGMFELHEFRRGFGDQ
jgi:peptidyl-prolyl cis-trans isomerase B (cyclophilin B)